MIGRILLAAVMVLGLGWSEARAESRWRDPVANEDWMHDVTVLTIFGEAWGTATDPITDVAIARAIANCKAMSGAQLGCGSFFTTIWAGWSLGILCGRTNIVVADKSLAEAERKALRRETELRTHYNPELPACVRVVTVDPNGVAITPDSSERQARQ